MRGEGGRDVPLWTPTRDTLWSDISRILWMIWTSFWCIFSVLLISVISGLTSTQYTSFFRSVVLVFLFACFSASLSFILSCDVHSVHPLEALFLVSSISCESYLISSLASKRSTVFTDLSHAVFLVRLALSRYWSNGFMDTMRAKRERDSVV